MDFQSVLESNELGLLTFLKGRALAYISDVNKYDSVPDKISISDALYLEGSFIASIRYNRGGYSVVYPSLNGQVDLFYVLNRDKICIGFDFYEMVKKSNSLTYNITGATFFMKYGLFKPGETFFKEIHRIKIGDAIIFFDDGTWKIVSLPLKSWSVTDCMSYKKGLIETMKLQSPDSAHDFMMFSGGRDSVLLSLLLKEELGIKMQLVTGVPHGMNVGENWHFRSDYFTQFLDTERKIIDYDYNDYSFEDLSYLVEKMPLTVCDGIGIEALNNYVSQNGGRAWTGQDADAMYVLGLSGGRYKDILSRFFISDGYIKSLYDVKGMSVSQYFGKLLSLFASLKCGKNFKAPQNIQELKTVLLNRQGSLPLIDFSSRMKTIPPLDRRITVEDAKSLLYMDRISYYITGRDHRIWSYAAKVKNPPVFPYSSVLMILLSINIKRGLKNIFINKYYISKIIRKYIGTTDFSKLYPLELFATCPHVQMEYSILHDTRYGKTLSVAAGNYKGDSFQEALHLAWKNKVMDKCSLLRKDASL